MPPSAPLPIIASLASSPPPSPDSASLAFVSPLPTPEASAAAMRRLRRGGGDAPRRSGRLVAVLALRLLATAAGRWRRRRHERRRRGVRHRRRRWDWKGWPAPAAAGLPPSLASRPGHDPICASRSEALAHEECHVQRRHRQMRQMSKHARTKGIWSFARSEIKKGPRTNPRARSSSFLGCPCFCGPS